MLPAIVVGVGFLAAAAAPPIMRAGRSAALVLALAPLAALAALWLASSRGQEPKTLHLDWAPTLGLALTLRLDGLAVLFGVLVSAIGALVCVYAGGYLGGRRHAGRFFAWLLLFMASMLGAVACDNLLVLYVFWELTTITSWLLIGFEHDKQEARKSAWQALIVTALGGLAMLAGFVLLGQAAGTYQISTLLEAPIPEAAPARWILALVLAGAMAKSALAPLHFWLPNAMAAPTPVSAYLHSATMVTLGVFLLARLTPLLEAAPGWTAAVGGVGGATAVLGAWLALMQTDLKKLLAYTTISALGVMTLMLAVGGPQATRAALTLLVAHALYKGAMFMIAGSIDHGAGSRDLDEIGGLWRSMPCTAAASLLAMASMVALPPTLGFIADEELLAVGEEEAAHGRWLVLAALLAWGVLYSAAGFVAGLRPFIGGRRAPQEPHETSPMVCGPPLLMGVAGLALAFLPANLDRLLIAPATEAVARDAPAEHLSLWHGVEPPLLMGMAMLAAGGLIAWGWRPLRRAALRLGGLRNAGPDRAYGRAEAWLQRGAAAMDRVLQHGYLPAYMVIVLLTVLALVALPLWHAGVRLPQWATPPQPADLALVGLTLVAAIAAAVSKGRVLVITCMSLVGYTVALLFATFGAPDVAITQVLVETLLTVLVVLLLPSMPSFDPISRLRYRLADALLCAAIGAMVSVLLLGAVAARQHTSVSRYFVEHSVDLGGGHNVVNTVLVNFRAADTLGEIIVLWVAAMGVAVLLGRHRRQTQRLATRQEGSLVLTIAATVLLPLVLVFAVYLLVMGHNTPGGGFAAGLVLAAGLGLMLVASPRFAERELLWLRPRTLAAAGLLLAAASGAWALMQGGALLSARWLDAELPLLGGVHLGTPLLFDVGVCLVAAGATFLLLRILEEHSPWSS